MASACVIAGASLAGATAAITMRDQGAYGTVTLISAEYEPPYERQPLSNTYLSRRAVNLDQLRDERVDLRSLRASP